MLGIERKAPSCLVEKPRPRRGLGRMPRAKPYRLVEVSLALEQLRRLDDETLLATGRHAHRCAGPRIQTGRRHFAVRDRHPLRLALLRLEEQAPIRHVQHALHRLFAVEQCRLRLLLHLFPGR